MFETIYNLIYSNPIDFLSLLISLYAIFYTFWHDRLNLKLTCKRMQNFHVSFVEEINSYDYSFDCLIENRSKDPITITNIKLNKINIFPAKIAKKGWGVKIYSNEVTHDIYTIPVPLKLDSYESIDGMLMFLSDKEIKLKRLNILKVYTTRGKSFKLILAKKTKA